MMKNFIAALLCSISFMAVAQSKITVKSTGNQSPIANASITCNGKILGKTNSNGQASFNSKCKTVSIAAPGYYEDEVVVDKVMEITLAKTESGMQQIKGVILSDKSDPKALAILKKVNDHFAENSPQSLDSYQFKAYQKASYDFDEDSVRAYNNFINHRIDSLKKMPQRDMDKQKKKDSLQNIQILKMLSESKLFLWERASDYKFSKSNGEKITVLDNRISGVKEPLYELMTLRSNRNQMPKEVREENRSLYRYFLTDSIEIEGRKNYVIRFRQVNYRTTIQRRKYNGYLYVDAQTYALKKIESNSKVKSDGSITSIWDLHFGKWFLTHENLKVKLGAANFDTESSEDSKKEEAKKFGTYVFLTSDYFDFNSPIDVKSKDFKGYTMAVENSDGKTLNQYRTQPLTDRELMTYEKIDSLGTRYKFDQKASLLTGLAKGKIRVGMVDFDLGKLVGYNLYEGFRLGLGVKLNDKFNRYLSPDAYVAYGFKDAAFKFGAGVDVKTTLEKNSFFRAEYFKDVLAAGKFDENQWNFRMKLMNSGINMKNDRFYKFEGFKLSYENDITNGLTVNVSAKKNTEEAGFDYGFLGMNRSFDNFATAISIKYSPNSKNIMTPNGKFTYQQSFPEVYLNYEQGLKSLRGEFEYSRFNALLVHNFKTGAGVTGFRFYGGLVNGEVPIWHHFTMNGLGSGKDGINFNLTSYLGFATMEAGKYFNDRFAGYYFTHRLPWHFKSFGKNVSSIDLIYRGVIGNMSHPEYHQLEFEKLDRLYQEVGLEYNNFLSSQFNLGFFYRIGHYNTPVFKQNFAIQFKFKFLGF